MAAKRDRSAFERPDKLIGTPVGGSGDRHHGRDDGTFVPVWKQDARDDSGRKRFHGAFTGGFSAGYFNTVGSKQGWTPTTFSTSRTSRADGSRFEQRAEQFMDDDDVADAADRIRLSTAATFSALGSGREANAESQPRPADLLSGLLRSSPGDDGIGVKLLQRMGWRLGQGIGPKQRRRARLGDSDVDDRHDPTGKSFLFAPEKTAVVLFAAKKDVHGLGFGSAGSIRRLDRDDGNGNEADDNEAGDAAAATAGIRTAGATKRPILPRSSRRTGFGTGVLDDSDSDDPYATGPRISTAKKAGGKKKRAVNGGATAAGAGKPLLKSASSATTSRDGRAPLPGFVLADVAVRTRARFGVPDVPAGWTPVRLAVRTNVQPMAGASATTDQPTPLTNPESRRTALGEEALAGKSVFDFLTPAGRARLAATTGRTDLPVARSEKVIGDHSVKSSQAGPPSSIDRLVQRIPHLDVSVATAALDRVRGAAPAGWTPYSDDPAKRARYIGFLHLHLARAEAERAGTVLQPDGVPDEIAAAARTATAAGLAAERRFDAEIVEFSQAARVFRRIEGAIADRFRPSGSVQIDSVSDVAAQDPAVLAAAAGMYGPTTTRSVCQFGPTRLVSRRFGVPPLESASSDTDHGDHAVPAVSTATPPMVETQDDTNVDALLAHDRPVESVFQAVFGDDSDSDVD